MSRIPSREEALFVDVLAQPPMLRASFLAQPCGNDPSLVGRIAALLAAHEGQESLMLPKYPGASVPADLSAAGLAKAKEKTGDAICHYKLLQKIGEGGCGVVWIAEQKEPVRRRVALKVIKLGMDTKADVARFEAERQALVMMDHPNIAKVHDAGSTETGRPYFVMELVRGIPITRFCDDNKLPAKERLQLFVSVSRATAMVAAATPTPRTMKALRLPVAIVATAVMLSSGTLGQDFPKAEKHANAKFYTAYFIKFKPGKIDEGRKIIADYFEVAGKNADNRAIAFKFQSGDWHHVVYFPWASAVELEWKMSPQRERWWAELAKHVGGPLKAKELMARWLELVADEKWEIAIRSI